MPDAPSSTAASTSQRTDRRGSWAPSPDLARSIVRSWLAAELAGSGSTRKAEKIDRLEREARAER